MNSIFEIIAQPWPWYVAGVMIALVMFMLLYFGNTFGISSNLRTICSLLGASKNCEYFDFSWKSQRWNLVFALGMIIGGYLAATYLNTDRIVNISEETIAELSSYGMAEPGTNLVPVEIFNWSSLLTLKGFVTMILGGFLVGFGTRYAGGCTSGHAITGLSDLQLPSLIAVIGFFIGGLTITYFVLPYLLPI